VAHADTEAQLKVKHRECEELQEEADSQRMHAKVEVDELRRSLSNAVSGSDTREKQLVQDSEGLLSILRLVMLVEFHLRSRHILILIFILILTLILILILILICIRIRIRISIRIRIRIRILISDHRPSSAKPRL
jgi:hypothetical protein